MNVDKHVCFFDNMRAFGIAMVILLHGSMIYMQEADPRWYVHSPQHSPVFTALAILVDVPAVPILFFIAAYFLRPSLRRRDPKTFLKDKFIRIGVPWIIGVVFLTPPVAYLAYYTRGVPLAFGDFLSTYFWDDRFQQGAYWFLGFLFFFFVISGAFYYSTRRLRFGFPLVSPAPWKVLSVFWTLTTLALLCVGELGVNDGWFIDCRIIIFQPWRLPVDIGYLCLGIVVSRLGWFTQDGYRPRLTRWAALWAVSGVLYLGMYFRGAHWKAIEIIHNVVCNDLIGRTPLTLHLERAVLFNTFCLCSLMIGASVFQCYLNRHGRWQAVLARNSYGAYYIHPLILYPLATLCLSISVPLVLKVPLVISLALFLSWASSALLLKKMPGLTRVF